MPLGHRPTGANESAPLPKLGQLPLALFKALTPRSAPVQQQAAVAPPPNPRVNQPVPNPAPAAPDAAAAQPGPDISGPAPTSIVGWVTGPDSPNNTIRRFAVSGTDLGLLWDNGGGQVLMAFGDTSGYCVIPGHQWRYNVLMRSDDRSLSNTVSVGSSPALRPGIAKQVINSIKAAPSEDGIIPTAGVSVGGTQYLNFMSIKQWESSGAWSTNFSAIAMSPNNGETWAVYPGTVRPPEGGNENFQMGAYLKGNDGYIYSFGTPPGRGGSVYLTRVPQNFVPDLTKYEYWNGTWVPNNPAAATPVIPGPVGEMSAQYNTYLKRYLVLYCNGNNDVVARTAPAPQGPWGPEQMLVSSFSIPGGIYAPFLHPWSTGKDLYFNLSLWSAYNVMLMHTVLP
ncbi:MAG TPA: DUF4185 domain-containing protein [Mycobacterium sp.]|nr:DUF4185 domain-containing protein [Mycobacterium sp.]